MRYAVIIFLCCISFAQTVSRWKPEVQTDRIDGSKLYALTNSSLKSKSDRRLELTVMCKEGKLDAYFYGTEIVDSHDGTIDIRTRLDGFDPADETWDVVSRDRGFILSGQDAQQFISDIVASKTLLVEYPLFSGPKVIAQFSVSGLKAQLSKLQGCIKVASTPKMKPCTGARDWNCIDSDGIIHPNSY